ncbi:sigma factor [Methylobacterium durans]|uniref:sigma factor n=1 Tax=Methylobacterium durans TaxID=2202825 RepID=UPI0030029FC4
MVTLQLGHSQVPMINPDQNQRVCLTAALRAHLGSQLRACYGTFLTENQPQRLLDLIRQLETALASQKEPDAAAFRDGLLAAVPRLHTYAMSLTGNAARADDLVQEALLRAWSNSTGSCPAPT